MTAPIYTCWLCGNLGALRPGPSDQWRSWVPFKATEPINLARDEHVSPACRGSQNPRRTEFPIQLGGAM